MGSTLGVADIESPTVTLPVGEIGVMAPLGMSVGEVRFTFTEAIDGVTVKLNEGPTVLLLNVGMATPELRAVDTPPSELEPAVAVAVELPVSGESGIVEAPP